MAGISTDQIQGAIEVSDFQRKNPGQPGKSLKLATTVDPVTNTHTLKTGVDFGPLVLPGDQSPTDGQEALLVAQRSMVT